MMNAMIQNLTNALAENRRAAKEDADLPQQRMNQPTKIKILRQTKGCRERMRTAIADEPFLRGVFGTVL